MRARGWLAAPVVAAALLAAPAAAPAATTCDLGTQVLQVDLQSAGDDATLKVLPGGEIEVRGIGGSVVACTAGPPTVTNTNAISIFNHAGSSDNFISIETAGAFTPGATLEPGSDEIEIYPTLNGAPSSSLHVVTGSSGGAIRFGDGGINPNATAAEDTPDADIFPAGVAVMRGFGSSGPDFLGAQGGLGTGNPLTSRISLEGAAGPDFVTGGNGDDSLFGGPGIDNLDGLGGSDALFPGTEDDELDGGVGTDTAEYGDHADGVAVDLSLTGPQLTGGSGMESLTRIENVVGTAKADVLRGDEEPNLLDGFVGGDDELEGRGGTDMLLGRSGADMLHVRDGGPDSADCGAETDIVTADARGTDTLIACETTLFPAVAQPPAAGGTVRDRTLARLTGFRLSRSRFVAGRATKVRYSLSEPATVRFTVERLRRGRYRKLKGSFVRRARRGRNSLTFRGVLRRRKLKPGRYRLVATATDAARNRSRPRRLRFRIVRR